MTKSDVDFDLPIALQAESLRRAKRTPNRAAAIASFALGLALSAIPAANPATVGGWGVDLSDQDRSVSAGGDFYAFENGAWLARTELGPSQPNAAYWRDLRIAAGRRVGAMMAELAHPPNASHSHADVLVANFYRSAMDTARIDALGATPLAAQLGAIRSANRETLATLMGQIEGPGTVRQPTVRRNPGRDLFALQIGSDQDDPRRYALTIGQAGLILPGPEYYVDPSFADLRAAYRAHVARMLALIGWSNADAGADQVVALETEIARASATHEQQRNAAAGYHRITLAELERQAPGFPWRRFLAGAGVPTNAPLAIDFPDAISGIAAVYAHAPIEALRAKQAFGAAFIDAVRLGTPIYQEYRDFATTALAGIQAGPNRDLDVINLIEASIPDAVGEAYVARFSSPRVKREAALMAEGMQRALVRRIGAAAWLSAEGRAAAQAKLATLRIHVGYPDHFDRYAGLVIRADDFYGNIARAAAYGWRAQVSQLRRPVALNDWQLTPFYPQYFYDPTRNTVEVPAALLTPPFFDPDADAAVNYGADGTLIGSQIAAAIIGPGASFDATGRLRSWLPPADAERLAAMRARLANRYSREEPLPGMHINGALVADEALADLGGMTLALDAYHQSLEGRTAPDLDGFNGDQRFFLGWAQMWRAKFSAPFMRNQLATGSNSPPYMRVNGPIPNLDDWYGAFSVRAGQRLFVAPDERVRPW
jgi:putative endopeptidase